MYIGCSPTTIAIGEANHPAAARPARRRHGRSPGRSGSLGRSPLAGPPLTVPRTARPARRPRPARRTARAPWQAGDAAPAHAGPRPRPRTRKPELWKGRR
ncbi:hypothetical protein PVAP13_7KG219255 [Panicum virgatum]|uniref:Uncharacterized protein n=1 Tax=Panicum virgatum TaxID=38727 RepID=A0A8T0QH12_PANVG|nr:hypothetical protein PVAP13_7KG219255 [Panicum virgatum]